MADSPAPKKKVVKKIVKKIVKKKAAASEGGPAEEVPSGAIMPSGEGDEFAADPAALAAEQARRDQEQRDIQERMRQEEAAASAAAAAHPEPRNFVIVKLNLGADGVATLRIHEFVTGRIFLQMAAKRSSLTECEHFDICTVVDNQDKWLQPDTPLLEQGVVKDTVLYLKVKYFAANVSTFSDPVAVRLYFQEVSSRVISGLWPCTQKQAVRLASYMVQAEFHDHDEATHVPGFFTGQFSLERYLPRAHVPAKGRKTTDMETEILGMHAFYVGMFDVIAQINYVEYASDLEAFGTTFFDLREGCIGVSPKGVGFYDANKKPTRFYKLGEEIRTFIKDNDRLTLETAQGPVTFSGPGVSLSSMFDLLNTYTTVLRTGRMEGLSATSRQEAGQKVRVQVHMCDDSFKNLIITEQTTGQDLINEFASKIDLKERKYFAVCDSSADTDRWLDPRKLLLDQFVSGNSNLYFKLRFLFADALDEIKDPMAIHLYYIQAKQNILEGHYVVSWEQAIEFAARHVTAEFGLYDAAIHRPGCLSPHGMEKYIPSYMIDLYETEEWERLIFAKHATLTSFPTPEAVKIDYVNMAKGSPYYGMTYFDVIDDNDRPVYLGVNWQGVAVFEKEKLQTLNSVRYQNLVIDCTKAAAVVKVRSRMVTKDPLTSGQYKWDVFNFTTMTPLQASSIVTLAKVFATIAFNKSKAARH